MLTVVVVCVLSLMPFPHIELAEDVPLADKWTHMVMYGGLVAIVWLEYVRRNKPRHIHLSFGVCVVACATLLGGALELLQAYATTTRSGEWLDLLADFIGAVLGALVGLIVGSMAKENR